ncbi:MAG: hypothetical protein M1132_01275 [Chloroflexi bacterium]|nr:hypothetical protein [Chloroflexota bacterium]
MVDVASQHAEHYAANGCDELRTQAIGACGIACSVCRLYSYGVCNGCQSGNLSTPEQVSRSTCPILRCAAAKSVPFCNRDCLEYPCLFFKQGVPVCTRYSEHEPESFEAMDPSAWTRVGLRVAGDGLTPHLEGPPAQLYIFCLGPFRVFRNGKKITEAEWGRQKGATHKIKAMLAYLVASVPQGARKDELFDILWPDKSDRDGADGCFHTTLHYLRQALEPDLRRGEESQFVVCRDGYYQINPALGYWVDAIAFEIHYRQAQRAEEQGKRELAARQYKLAEALYQGDYMAGIEARYTERYDADWCQWRRFRLKSTAVNILLKLADYHEQEGQDRLSLHYARKALLQENCCEEAHSFVMRALHRAGRRSDLVRQYRLLERLLRQREDRVPSPEVTRLYKELTFFPTRAARPALP